MNPIRRQLEIQSAGSHQIKYIELIVKLLCALKLLNLVMVKVPKDETLNKFKPIMVLVCLQHVGIVKDFYEEQ